MGLIMLVFLTDMRKHPEELFSDFQEKQCKQGDRGVMSSKF